MHYFFYGYGEPVKKRSFMSVFIKVLLPTYFFLCFMSKYKKMLAKTTR
jgi:hypothetical protein